MMKNDEVRQALTRKRDELQQKLTEIQNRVSTETAAGETDTAHEWENAEVREDLAQEASDELDAVQAALTRVENGTYSICTSCEKPIDVKRLKSMPEALLCIACAEQAD
jgi:DnaK suppressor protein